MVEKLFYTQTSQRLASKQFVRLVADCQFPEDTNDTWVLAEHIPDHAVANPKDPAERQKMLLFDLFNLYNLEKQEIQLSNYNSGRIFGENMEIRWEKQNGKIHVVYLGTDKYTSILRDYGLQENLDILEKTQAVPKSYYLFGERLKTEDLRYMDRAATTKHFAEVRIPQLLLYPVPPSSKPYVCLQVREYINAETGVVELFRFQKLEARG
jgi:hypothetical protein